MKKKFTDQIYQEGLGANLYAPVSDAIKKSSHKKAKRILSISWKIAYTIIAIILAILLFLFTFPLL